MRSIIETIQKEQDIIIRDTDSDLMIVQGVAGSGKTSIALHRVAFLLYEGMSSKLSANNILVLSPNDAFNNYIGHVLPELGEENVERGTMESIVKGCLEHEVKKSNTHSFEGRNKQLEACIDGRGSTEGDTISQWVQFKGSSIFTTIIDRYLRLYERCLHPFEDVYYNGIFIASRNEVKSEFLNNKTAMPMAKRLKRIESRIQDSIADLRKERLKRLEAIVQEGDEHEFEVKSFSRLLLMKDSQAFANKLEKFTELDAFALYQDLFKDKTRFHILSKGLMLPQDIDEIIENTYQTIKNKKTHYEDWNAIAYIRLNAFGTNGSNEIRQVVIDEVQDYYPMQLAIMKKLYGGARFTVVGDIAQSIERSGELSIYDAILNILGKSKTIRLSLNRSYRASFEINEFAKGINDAGVDSISFPRHEEQPEVLSARAEDGLWEMMFERVHEYFDEGFETVAILCKTMKQTKTLYHKIKDRIESKIFDGTDAETNKGCMIMPVYAAKGLEFDAVLVFGVDDLNYNTGIDRRLLYIACTRALHRLSLYYTGERSRFLYNTSYYNT